MYDEIVVTSTPQATAQSEPAPPKLNLALEE
jgi:hypothetical protein